MSVQHTPGSKYESVLEPDDYRMRYHDDELGRSVTRGDQYWDAEERFMHKVVDVVVRIGNGVVRPVGERSLNPTGVIVVTESDHPAHTEDPHLENTSDGNISRFPLTKWDEYIEDGRLVAHSANDWMPYTLRI